MPKIQQPRRNGQGQVSRNIQPTKIESKKEETGNLNRLITRSEAESVSREFPGGPVARTWHFHCCGLGSISDQETYILQAMHCGQKKKTL